jgi:hypothetical protein
MARRARGQQQGERASDVQLEEFLVTVATRSERTSEVVNRIHAINGGSQCGVIFQPPGHQLDRRMTDSHGARIVRQDERPHFMPGVNQQSSQMRRYLAIQQDLLETYVDRGQLARLRQPTIAASARRTPGLKLDDPRLLAVMQALTCFAHLSRGGRFRTRDLHQRAAETLGFTTATYRLGQLRYDLAKLRAKGLVVKVPKTHTYRLTRKASGSVCCS